ncbi:MAG TPA: glycosyltransferase family 2 protein, partial [Gemmataceae bacterium]|nr:glycosyltransferase family 2 protein [Gemmataceae bacterium]
MDPVTPPRLLVVIVNYRTADLTIDCLRSLAGEAAALPGLRAVVVDNASGDGSAQRLAAAVREYPWASFQPLAGNHGFAAGNNAGLKPALSADQPPQYILLLNPDTAVRPGGVHELLRFLEAHPDVGLVGPRLEDPEGTPQRSAFRFPTVLGELENGTRLGLLTRALSRYVVAPPVPVEACRSDWLSGACLLVRREVFEAVGLLDEGYFLYFEEVDFCRRAADAGWPCWYVPSARVVHRVGSSTGWTTTRRRPGYWFASRRRYLRRHLGAGKTLLADVLWTTGYASYRLRRPIQGKPDTDPRHLLGDFVRWAFANPGVGSLVFLPLPSGERAGVRRSQLVEDLIPHPRPLSPEGRGKNVQEPSPLTPLP